jgi:hypothetical protein
MISNKETKRRLKIKSDKLTRLMFETALSADPKYKKAKDKPEWFTQEFKRQEIFYKMANAARKFIAVEINANQYK